MPLKESEAIVLRSSPLGEGDRLVSFLDRQAGRLRGIARGARVPKSRFGSTLELLSHIRIWYFERENRELVRINQCELIESFLDLQRDYRAGVFLALISEVTEAVLGEREVEDAQFRLLLLTAKAIRNHGPSSLVLAYFSLWTARLGGWLGPFDRCTRCGREVQRELLFASFGSPGLSCADCRDEWMRPLSPAAQLVGRGALSGTLEVMLKEKHSEAASNDISRYALDVIEYHIERKLISRQMLDAEINGQIKI